MRIRLVYIILILSLHVLLFPNAVAQISDPISIPFTDTYTMARIFQNHTHRYESSGMPRSATDSLYLNYVVAYGESDDEVVNDTCLFTIRYEDGYKTLVNIFYPAGEMLMDFTFKKGVKHGACKEWFPNGSIRHTSYFSDGEYISPYISYYQNGAVSEIMRFNSKDRATLIMRFYENGRLKEEYMPLSPESVEAEVYTSYFKSGAIATHTIFHRGRQLYTQYYENGQRYEEGHIMDAPWGRVGVWKYWDEEGSLIKEIDYDAPSEIKTQPDIELQMDKN